MKKQLLYLCGPYRDKTPNGIWENIQRARRYALELWRAGYIVLSPHMNTSMMDGALPDSVWLEGDIEMMTRCDVVAFMPGWEKSTGCKNEMEVCEQRKIPVMFIDVPPKGEKP